MPDGTDTTQMIVRAFKLREPDAADESRVIDCIASTDTEDTYGDSIEQDTWQLDRYAANPVVLYMHNSREMPIGLASNVRVEGGKLLATLTLTSDDINPRAGEVWRAYKAKLLRCVSVGFIAHSYRWEKREDREVFVLSDCELLEISVCTIGANPDALMKFRQRAIDTRGTTKDTTMTEEEKKLLAAALALTGKSSTAEAVAALPALGESLKTVDSLRAEVKRLTEERDVASRSRTIEQGVRDGKITPAMREDAAWVEMTKGFSPAQLEVYVKTLPKALPGAVEEKKDAGPNAGANEVQITADDREICKRMGLDEAKFLEQKRADLAARRAREAR